MSTHHKFIVILGPTASGKTTISLKLAQNHSVMGKSGKFDGFEIISADSRQIYRDFNIGTDKISGVLKKIEGKLGKELGDRGVYLDFDGIKHYMIDIVDADQVYSLAEYKEDAIKIIKDIQRRGKIPMLVGGTGLYISAIVDNYDIPKGKPNLKLRKELEKLNNEELLKKLKKLDPRAAEIIDYKNQRRLVRALEICLQTGKTFSSLKNKNKPLFEVLMIGLKPDRENLNNKIVQRIEEQFEQGLEDEVRNLSKKYSWDLPAMTGICYQEFRLYFQGEKDLNWVKSEMVKHNQQYGKRQMTWFKRDKRIEWIEDYYEAERLIKDFLS